jgi:hypothetical protein
MMHERSAAAVGATCMPSVEETFFDDFYDLITLRPTALSEHRSVYDRVRGFKTPFPLAHLLIIAKMAFDKRSFSVDDDGIPALLLPAVNERNEIDDYVALGLDQQAQVATTRDRAWCLGELNATMSNVGGAALLVCPSVWAWLEGGGAGVFIFNYARALRELHERGIQRLAVRTMSERAGLKRAFDRAVGRLVPNITIISDAEGA